MKFRIMLSMALVALPAAARAQETAGRDLAASCAQCHGTQGRSVTAEVAPLAGLPKEHIVSRMRAFKDGTRPATVMHQLAKGYTDAQIDIIAGYFAKQSQ